MKFETFLIIIAGIGIFSMFILYLTNQFNFLLALPAFFAGYYSIAIYVLSKKAERRKQ